MIRVRARRLTLRLAVDALSNFFRREDVRARDVLSDQQRIVLDTEEATYVLDSLDTVKQDTVVRLRELHERA